MMANKNKDVGSICTYRIDAGDRIVSVGENWQAFADENNAQDACFAPRVIGSSIWDHIQDPETHHIYKVLVEKVRQTGAPITMPLRCDAPDLIRELEITLIPESDGDVTFLSKTIRVEPRASAPLLAGCQPRSEDFVRICSFCKKIDLDGDQWVEIEAADIKKEYFNDTPLPQLTHGVCPICFDIAMAELSN